ncbi:PREDICTED: uncharacterized protein LOC105569035 [Vollenhovia emeryi]|uniref:uncharacterized protein LOC105569035 n=1 Tax=Vollenhovia emeryi TaxID=411798 RepID=UPI0005F50E51|nr:PREDICTED: uncharacterized protein LOC105569035 [Vollenhovia emeryi]
MFTTLRHSAAYSRNPITGLAFSAQFSPGSEQLINRRHIVAIEITLAEGYAHSTGAASKTDATGAPEPSRASRVLLLCFCLTSAVQRRGSKPMIKIGQKRGERIELYNERAPA